jgi:hypothetical protein
MAGLPCEELGEAAGASFDFRRREPRVAQSQVAPASSVSIKGPSRHKRDPYSLGFPLQAGGVETRT